jgi:CO/xanthine dehydrogenase Mo-binding subunit
MSLQERELSRRTFLKGGGALIVGFSVAGAGLLPARASADVTGQPFPNMASIDSWIKIDVDGTVTLLSGKVSMGTGSSTGLLQIVAEELDVPMKQMRLVSGVTGVTPNQFTSSASNGISAGGAAARVAAAEARAALLQMASTKLGAPVGSLTVTDGVVSVAGDASKRVTYAELVGGKLFNLTPMTPNGQLVTGTAKAKDPATHKIVGTDVPRIDIPDMVTGTFTFVNNIRLPGMLHGRIVRANPWGADLVRVEGLPSRIPDLVKIVVRDNFVGVLAKTEYAAVQAAAQLKVKWADWAEMPAQSELYKTMRSVPVKERTGSNVGNVEAALATAAKTLSATYHVPYNGHGTIGPSAAVADVSNGKATIWTQAQNVYGLRTSLSVLLGMPEANVQVIFTPGGGAFGQNGSDDAAADAALLSQAVGRPVRVQWMRQEEHGRVGYAPARTVDFRAGLDAQGRIVAWDDVAWAQAAWNRPASNNTAEGYPGNLLNAGLIKGMPPLFDNGPGTVLLTPAYTIPNRRVVVNYLGNSTPRAGVIRIRTGSLRTVGSTASVFPVESFVDELATAAGADPVQFRLQHLGAASQRAIDAINATAALANWDTRPSPKPGTRGTIVTGRGIATRGNVAVVAEVEVNRTTGKVRVTRAWCAHECGLIVNPDGIRSQVEGSIVMFASRAINEQVTFTRSAITSLDWVTYPIMRFKDAPDEVQIQLINRKDQPSSGAGELSGPVIAPAIANAFFDATGVRMRQLPLTPARVRATLAAAQAGTYT